MSCKPFLLIHTFKDISKLGEGQSYYNDNDVRYNIPWRLQIFRKAGFLGLNLRCEKEECFGERKWSFQTKFTMKLVAVSGKFFRRTVQYEFQKPEGHGMNEFISWENMLRDYVDNESIIIEIHADIVSSTGFFEQKYLKYLQPNSNNSFVLKHTFKNISRLVERRSDYSDLEEHFNIPWRMQIEKYNEFLATYLCCDKEMYEGRKLSIECEYEFKLISASGKLHSKQNKAIFGASNRGIPNFISWNDMEKDYVTNGSIDVEVHVKIIQITELSCQEKSFVLSHTVKNMSSIEEGRIIFSDTQTRFNILWKLKIRKQDGFFELFLLCDKQLCKSRKWSIETVFQLKIVSSNGRSLVLLKTTRVFNKATGYGWLKLIRWDSLEEKYIVDDTLTIEAHVKILNMTGIEDETAVEKPSGIIIPVEDQEYSLEKWMEMAFDH
ncbi:MATH domain-containing protein [Caenorhabditis elegans]|uniref:MATH domain-containing protein n=1 Tax=Caenorhabditis elegans TaxID=6239 RepID=O76558_CAEEL|nr:MATH domain-containing protein [Caenorhabditis elegans]CCD67122.1 MATH domain-containing protein [Caenorhabditis elegans]|eukprot:NP_494146.1 MATH (meprin-associated Traf homology) domain containing [Caenorhabditis elegans]